MSISRRRTYVQTYKRLLFLDNWAWRSDNESIRYSLERLCFGAAESSPYTRSGRLLVRLVPVVSLLAKYVGITACYHYNTCIANNNCKILQVEKYSIIEYPSIFMD